MVGDTYKKGDYVRILPLKKLRRGEHPHYVNRYMKDFAGDVYKVKYVIEHGLYIKLDGSEWTWSASMLESPMGFTLNESKDKATIKLTKEEFCYMLSRPDLIEKHNVEYSVLEPTKCHITKPTSSRKHAKTCANEFIIDFTKREP